ncbi:hypothetical protein AGR1C_Lc20081 [Agrobacterium fabacearum TT111]|nr:hypothetical protein AGR1C_Lc20081 [Agrobacterium fabacearum TT111]
MLETHPVANRTLLCLWQSRYDPAWTFGLVGPKYARLQKDSIAGTIRIFAHESLPMAKKNKRPGFNPTSHNHSAPLLVHA